MYSRYAPVIFVSCMIALSSSLIDAKIYHNHTSPYYKEGYNALTQFTKSPQTVSPLPVPLIKKLGKKLLKKPSSKEFKKAFTDLQSYLRGMQDRLAVEPTFKPFRMYLNQALSCIIEAKNISQAYRSIGRLLIANSQALKLLDTRSFAHVLDQLSSVCTLSPASYEYKLGKECASAAMNSWFNQSESSSMDIYEKKVLTLVNSLKTRDQCEAVSCYYNLFAGYQKGFLSYPAQQKLTQIKEKHKKIMLSFGIDITKKLFRLPDALRRSTLASLVKELGEACITHSDTLATLS